MGMFGGLRGPEIETQPWWAVVSVTRTKLASWEVRSRWA